MEVSISTYLIEFNWDGYYNVVDVNQALAYLLKKITYT